MQLYWWMNNDLNQLAISTIEKARELLTNPAFIARHRKGVNNFIRNCKLTFPIVMLLTLQKSLKSIQIHLHEFFKDWSQNGHPQPQENPAHKLPGRLFLSGLCALQAVATDAAQVTEEIQRQSARTDLPKAQPGQSSLCETQPSHTRHGSILRHAVVHRTGNLP